jgi:putative ABC transport system permease protein
MTEGPPPAVAIDEGAGVFYLSYILQELRRRTGRTVLTALGLGVGVGLVITVRALSAGLDEAQEKVLAPLTGVGTDMTVSRPLTISSSGSGAGGFEQLTEAEREALREENGVSRLDFRTLTPGASFSTDAFVAGSQLSFPASQVTAAAKLSGVAAAAGGLTLNAVHIEGTVPDQAQAAPGGAPPGTGQGGAGGFAGPRSINTTSQSVAGVDETQPELGALTSGQVSSGSYFSEGDARQAILDAGYAGRKSLKVGSTLKLAGKSFTVIGLAKTPLGGQASDIYLKLAQLQKLSDRTGRVNTVYVRADSADQVATVAKEIETTFAGSSVTTAQDLADSISGSLVDAKNLSGKLGLALAIVGLLAAVLIATLLTLSSVTKRIRELGTLKAIGWPQRLVVRQVTGEALVQGLIGAGFGIVLGLAGVLLIRAFGPSLEASFASDAQNVGFGGPGGPFGQGAVDTSAASTTIALGAPISIGLIALAVLLAVGGGLIAGAAGGWRAARLRPAAALRHID